MVQIPSHRIFTFVLHGNALALHLCLPEHRHTLRPTHFAVLYPHLAITRAELTLLLPPYSNSSTTTFTMSYTKAKRSLTDMEMRRFTACYMHVKAHSSAVDWEAATADFDSGPKACNVDSFRTFLARAMKKYKTYANAKGITQTELHRFTAAFLNLKDVNSSVGSFLINE